jgi:branched-chain amino acid transport system substrate-binding protein
MTHSRWLGTAAAVAASAVLAAGCGSSSSSSSTSAGSGSSGSSTSATSAATTTASAGSFSFGTAKKATGSPYVFGMINDETGAVTFPEARQGAITAMQYVNNYLGGINGHPIVIDNCIGDGTPAGAARCAT